MRPPGTGARWLTFNAVGGVGIVVQLSTLAALTSWLRIPYLAATAVAVEAAIVHNFFWHERLTWSDRSAANSRRVRFLKFNFSTGSFSILGNLLLMKLFTGILQIPCLPANLASIASCSLLNFVVSDRFVFRKLPGVVSVSPRGGHAGAPLTRCPPDSAPTGIHAPSS